MGKSKSVPGVHIQWPWSQLIISGRKTVETRHYPLPAKYINQVLAIIETPGRNASKAGFSKARIVGTVRFSRCFRYSSKTDWANDRKRHLVAETDLAFGYGKKAKWGWEIAEVRVLNTHRAPPKKRGIIFATVCEI